MSLERYAHATAALADGFVESDALDLAGVAKSDWSTARSGWLKRIGGSGPDAPEFAEYQRLYAQAEDGFGRTVSPVDKDLTAWLVFLATCEKTSNLGALLEKLALRTSDLSRLSRNWKKRFELDPTLEPKIAELRKKGLPSELVPLKVGESKRLALPLGDAEPSPAAKPVPAAPATIAPEEIPLDRYAALRSDIDRGDRLGDVLARFRVEEKVFAAADAHYRGAFLKDPALAADFRVLRAHADRSPRQVAAPPVMAAAALTSAPAPAQPLQAPISAAPSVHTAELRMPRDRGLTLPFKTPAHGGSSSPAPPAAPAQTGDVLAIAARMSARDAMTGTAEGGIATPRPLPFSTKRRPAAPTAPMATPTAPKELSPFRQAATERAAALPSVDAALGARSIPVRRVGSAARALLTLEQHASMHAELGAAIPLAAVLARYGLSAAHREEVDEHYRLSFTRDPRVRVAWDQTYRAVTAWMRPPR